MPVHVTTCNSWRGGAPKLTLHKPMELKIADAGTFNYMQLLGGAPNVRLLRTFASVLGEKIHIRAILKENTTTYILLQSLINEDLKK